MSLLLFGFFAGVAFSSAVTLFTLWRGGMFYERNESHNDTLTSPKPGDPGKDI